MNNPQLTIDEWLQYGIDHNYCSQAVCATHDGLPMTPEEEQYWDEGYDPCSVGVRIWFDD